MPKELKEKEAQEPSFREKILTQMQAGRKRTSETADQEREDLVERNTLAFERPVLPSQDRADQESSLEETRIMPKPTVERKRTSRSVVKQHRKKQEKVANRIVGTIMVLSLLVLVVAGYTGYSYITSSLEPYNTKATDYVQVEIPIGSSTREIATILEKNKLIKNATVFTYYAKIKSYNNFQSGFYNLSQQMSVDELAKALQEIGTETAQAPIAGRVRVIEGDTIEQIAQRITDNVHTKSSKDKTPFTSEAFLALVQNPDFIASMVAKYPELLATLPSAESGARYRLEGYLYPATYDYTKETSLEALVEQMLSSMNSHLQPYYGQLADKGLTVNELLTIASLVEKEGSTDQDRRDIASVFYNRLNMDMPLQSNIAILYAMGKLGQETTLAEDAAIDTSIDSPYNIYQHTGLMPGPVVNPSLDAIEATFTPNKTDYLYFVADVTTGTVYFTQTIEEHNANVEKYINSKINN